MKIFLTGFMGSGKSYLGREIGKKLSIPFFDLDKCIEEHTGKSITQIFAIEGEEHFRCMEKEVLYMLTESHDTFVMATGGGTPCFYNNIDYLKKNGKIVWINCSTECIWQRLKKEKSKRPLIADMSDEELRLYILKKNTDRKIFYQQADIIINNDEIHIKELIDLIFHE